MSEKIGQVKMPKIDEMYAGQVAFIKFVGTHKEYDKRKYDDTKNNKDRRRL